MITSVLFDFFGTLVDYGRIRNEIDYTHTHEMLKSYGAKTEYLDFLKLAEVVFADFERDSKRDQIEFSMAQVMQALGDLMEIDLDEQALASLAESYTKEWSSNVVPVTDVRRFLTRLERDFRLGLITNTHYLPLVQRLLIEMDIDGLFEIVMTSIVHGRLKPHPDIFNDTLDQLGIAHSEAVYVGDNYQADYVGATQVGMRCYLVGQHARVPVEYQIPTVLDLPLHQLRQ